MGRRGPRRRNKFNARRTTLGEDVFDSKAEAARWVQLLRQQEMGDIHDLERQPAYDFACGATYRGDFRYRNSEGALVVEDVKGMETELFKLKARLMLHEHGITLRKVKMGAGEAELWVRAFQGVLERDSAR